jgi:hypothetical protein
MKNLVLSATGLLGVPALKLIGKSSDLYRAAKAVEFSVEGLSNFAQQLLNSGR